MTAAKTMVRLGRLCTGKEGVAGRQEARSLPHYRSQARKGSLAHVRIRRASVDSAHHSSLGMPPNETATKAAPSPQVRDVYYSTSPRVGSARLMLLRKLLTGHPDSRKVAFAWNNKFALARSWPQLYMLFIQ